MLDDVLSDWPFAPEWRDKRPAFCGTAEHCLLCGSNADACPLSDWHATNALCAIAGLEKPPGGWPDDTVERIIAVAKKAASY